MISNRFQGSVYGGGYESIYSLHEKCYDFSNQAIQHLDTSQIPPGTTSLFLDNNRILELPDDIKCLTDLRILRACSQLDLEQLHAYRKPALQRLPSSINYLKALSELSLCNNALETLPASMSTMTQLQMLDLRMNMIVYIPECIFGMESLAYLFLCGNKIKTIPNSIARLEHLNCLTIAQNRLDSLPESIGELLCLHTLDIRGNNIDNIPMSIYNLPCLKRNQSSGGLLVEGNPLRGDATIPIGSQNRDEGSIVRNTKGSMIQRQVTGVSCDFAELPSDSYVDMSNSRYRHHELSYDCIGHPDVSTICSLDVSGNMIETIKTNMSELKSLETLFLDDNHLSDFPAIALKNMVSLQKLNINKQTSPSKDGNYNLALRSLTDITYVDHLTHLHAAKNSIECIPPEIQTMKNLVELDLTDNKRIAIVPEGIGCLTKLTYLGLSGNSIKSIPPSIQYLKELRVLRLSSNELSCLPEEITELRNLSTLSLQDNCLVFLPIHFDSLTSLVDNNREQDMYTSPLMRNRQFPCSLNLRKNRTLCFPSSKCEKLSARELFELYHTLRLKGVDTMQALYVHAKSLLPKGAEKVYLHRWRFLDDKLLTRMSSEFGSDWIHVGINLGLTKIECEQIRENYQTNIRMAILTMLTTWRDSKGMNEELLVKDMLNVLSDMENESAKSVLLDELTRKGWDE